MIDFIREFLLQFGYIGSFLWMLLKILTVMMPLISSAGVTSKAGL